MTFCGCSQSFAWTPQPHNNVPVLYTCFGPLLCFAYVLVYHLAVSGHMGGQFGTANCVTDALSSLCTPAAELGKPSHKQSQPGQPLFNAPGPIASQASLLGPLTRR